MQFFHYRFIAITWIIISLGLIGCQAETGNVEPLNVAQVAVAAIEPTHTTSVTATAEPTAIISQLPTATKTPKPTNTPTPTPTPTLPPTDTPEPTATTDPNVCRPLSQTAGARSPYVTTNVAWPRPGAWDSEVYTGAVEPKMMHLGFDVEGRDDQLPALLDMLDRHGIKSTMFIMGSWANIYPEWIQEMNNRGHEFANHTWTHSDVGTLEAWQVQKELNDTEQIVMQLTGKTTKPWFRPPYGSRSTTSVAAAYQIGWTHVIWSGSSEDWRPNTTADIMCATLKTGAYPGAILYSHTSHPELVTALDMFISEMHTQGYTFVPLSVLMSNNPGNYLVAQ